MTFPRAPWWIYLIAACAATSLCLNAWNDVMGPEPAGWDRAGYTLQVKEVRPGGPFGKAGVHKGDVLLAVNGIGLRSLLDWDIARTAFEVGKPFALDVQRGEETLHLTVTPERRIFRVWDTSDYVTTLSLRGAQLILLALALLIVFKRPYDQSARLGGWLLASLAAWNYPAYGWLAWLRHTPVPITLLALAGMLLACSGATAWFCFFAMFPRPVLTKAWHWLVALLPGVIILPLYLWVVGWMYFGNQLAGLLPLWVWIAVVGGTVAQELAGLGILVSNYFRLRELNERRKVGVLLVGTAVGWVGLMAAVFLWPWFTLIAVAGWVMFLALPFSFAYVILRHRLFEVSVMVRQGLQYALARGVVVWAMPAAVGLFLLDVGVQSGDIGVAAIGNFFAHTSRGWVYAVIGALALVAHGKRRQWLSAIDRRFFRERYNAQQLLRQTAEELRASRSLEDAAPRIVTRIESALHPEFCALMVRGPNQPMYTCQAGAPAGIALPGLAADSKLMGAFRVFGKPLQISLSESGWLKQQLPHADTEFLRQARIELLVPVSLSATGREALLALGQKKSEEPYSAEDEELLLAIANSLALLLERPASVVNSSGLEECPRCGRCYDGGAGKCTQDASQLTGSSLPRLLAGRYRLDRRLGRGGMGTVYSALDTSLERQVALKLIREDLVSSAEAAERFRREAKAAAAIIHPNLATLFDFAVDADHRAFLVMELLSGVSLRQRMQKQGRLPAESVLEILRGVCSGVGVAHQRGLVHRDLKPENIFLTDNAGREVPKILDFGLAKFVGSGDSMTQATADTGAGVLVGTPLYASPEQLKGEPVSSRWDLWALAIITYEMVSGAHPFGNPGSVAALHNAILSGRFQPIDTHLPQAPMEWQEFFSRSLSADATRRPGSAGEFLSECERAFAKPSPQTAS